MARGSGVVVTVTVIEAMPGVVSMPDMCAAGVAFPVSDRYARYVPESHTVFGTIAAAAFGAVLYTVVTGDSVVGALTGLVQRALSTEV